MTTCGTCGKNADPHPYRHPVDPVHRCQVCLEVPLPDLGDGYENSTLILQCDRPDDHKGMHRYTAPISWSSPR